MAAGPTPNVQQSVPSGELQPSVWTQSTVCRSYPEDCSWSRLPPVVYCLPIVAGYGYYSRATSISYPNWLFRPWPHHRPGWNVEDQAPPAPAKLRDAGATSDLAAAVKSWIYHWYHVFELMVYSWWQFMFIHEQVMWYIRMVDGSQALCAKVYN